MTYLKTARKNYTTSIVNITKLIDNIEIESDKLSKKREIFSNDVNKIRKYKCNLKKILKDGRSDRNRADHGLEDKVNSLPHKFDIKRELFFGGKLNCVNCGRLINKNFFETSEGDVSNLEIIKK